MIPILTYTHSKASDIHEAYFGRLHKHYSANADLYVTCNISVPYGNCIVYDDGDPHWKQMVDALSVIDNEYVIYCQEDYILFDDVDIETLDRYVGIMNSDRNIGFVRLIKSGVGYGVRYADDLNYVSYYGNPYYFSTQPTIWRVDVLKDMFSQSRVKRIFDEMDNSPYLFSMDVKGVYSENVGSPVGGHYNSLVFPYIATAIVKGKWNVSEYPVELDAVFNDYNINPQIRGTR